MLDIIDSKPGMLAVIWLFGLAVIYMGVKDLSRRHIHLLGMAPRDAYYANDRMIETLHGDVDLAQQAARRRLRRERAAQQREQSYDGFKRYIENMVP